MATQEIKILNGPSLQLKEFKLASMGPNPSICMIAKRASGKSWLCRNIIKNYMHLPGGVIISKTERMNPFYGKFFPDLYIHYEYTSEKINRVLERQRQIIEKCKEKHKQGKKVDPRAFIIMDDCLASKGSWMNDQPMMEIFFNGRHYQLMFILTMQFPLGIRPELRCNFDYIFLLAEDMFSNQKRLYDHYAGMFPSFEAFRQVFQQLTADYGSMVIVNRGAKPNLAEKVFWFKATNEEVTHIGCEQFNKFHDKNYDAKWSDKNRSIDLNTYGTNKKKPKIFVEKMETLQPKS